MIGIGPGESAFIFLLIMVTVVGLIFYFAVTVLKRLSEISRGIRVIEENQPALIDLFTRIADRLQNTRQN